MMISPTTSVKPRKTQRDVLRYLQKSRKKGAGLVVLPTAVGKTMLAAFDTVQAKATTILFIVHSSQINRQAIREFAKVRDDITKENVSLLNREDEKTFMQISFSPIFSR